MYAPDQLRDFARRYTDAWCSQDPAKVAEHYAPEGSLTINAGQPAEGRATITEVVRSFRTLVGTNSGPGGTGRSVRISGFEEWTIGEDGLIAESQGHYGQAEYDRQLQQGVDEPR